MTPVLNQRSSYNLITLLIACILCVISASSVADSLRSTVDRSTISANETLTLRVRYTGNDKVQPDFSELNQDYEIVNQSRSEQYSVINGTVEAYTEWTLLLFPKREGRLVIPSFKAGNVFSEAIVVNVRPQTQLPTGVKDVVFIESSVNTSDAHVQQQVVLSYRFYYSVNVTKLEAPELQLDNVIIEALPGTNYQRLVNNATYNVAEYKFALFPQNSETIEIPATNWTAQISTSGAPRGFGFNTGRYELKRLRAEGHTITVSPQPASYPAGETWLPSSSVTITEDWAKDPSTFKVGEPITRTLTMRAKGLMASQLPQLSQEPADNRLKYYADQPVLNDDKTADGFVGERKETVAVVVSEGGEIVVPEINIPWWDTESNSVKYATLPERRFLVASNGEISSNRDSHEQAQPPASESPAQADTPVIVKEESRLWTWLTAIFAIISVALAMVCYILFRELEKIRGGAVPLARQPAKTAYAVNEAQAWSELENSASTADLTTVREKLLVWANKRWPAAHVHALSDIQRCIDDESIHRLLLDLDAALYGSSTTSQWQPLQLIAALQNWRNAAKAHKETTTSLAPLYPN